MIGISLDHRGDTPERAEAVLTRQGHDSKQWDYLLSKESLHPLMRDGFMLGVREGQNGLAAAHADRVVLVGKAGRIRGYYDLSANEGIPSQQPHRSVGQRDDRPLRVVGHHRLYGGAR